ncbi:Thioredoxin-like fold domain-containing protein MRL7, chloroplastic [Sesamum angolense]|uniref:Thioredoxin-like fold domain-containing protein MRL7, chloroplastic n=1 Tax=Sesamum angolense TaxID=2727404 RepID=A0AAE2C3E0_9LAMI|nr:Thioredoxin-like fold domain-containing protein MRL7, chloroplastic [Sesamum angolense]
MRIRKHAKISPLIYATSSLKPGTLLQTHVCQLNQSPWDVMSFSPPSTPPPPPPLFQVNGDCVSVGNGSSEHCISVGEREFDAGRQWEYSDDSTTVKAEEDEEEQPPAKNQQIILCCKTDGKSWQCKREAAKGNSLCEHHLSLVKNYNSLAHHATKKSEKPAPPESRHRPRPKKASTPSNPYEFYYYSGFGPRWGKKRGDQSTYKNNGNCIVPKVVDDHEHEREVSRRVDDNGDEFDYVEYEDEDEDDEELEERKGNEKKRMRKRIKARSAKVCTSCSCSVSTPNFVVRPPGSTVKRLVCFADSRKSDPNPDANLSRNPKLKPTEKTRLQKTNKGPQNESENSETLFPAMIPKKPRRGRRSEAAAVEDFVRDSLERTFESIRKQNPEILKNMENIMKKKADGDLGSEDDTSDDD